MDRSANPLISNATGLCPLLCAASTGEWQTIDALLTNTHQGATQQLKVTDKNGRTALMLASAEGHLSVVELLLSKGAPVTCADREGLTALSWACLRGHLHCTQLLLERGSDIDHEDKIKRTPLHLASCNGHEQVVQCLLERGADMEHDDISGIRPLDRAISCRHTAVVICFLRKGAKIGPSTWTMAAGKPDIMMLLLNKLLDDGNVLYKKNRIRDAAYRYQYALKKLPAADLTDDFLDQSDHGTFTELRVNLALNLSRCKRKLLDTAGAIDLATSVLDIKPNSFEAYYARARAKRDNRQYESALQDLTIALSLAPHNRELHRLLVRVEEECREASRTEDRPSEDVSRSSGGIPDIVPSDNNNSASVSSDVQRLKEETSL
jgi:ankyrin repeat protein